MDEEPFAERSLHDLYAEYDTLRQELEAGSDDERRAAWDAHYEDGSEGSRLHRRMRVLLAEIRRRERDFEVDVTSALGDEMRSDAQLSAEVYAALCNVDWEHEDGSRYGCSWRAAAGLVAEIRTGKEGDEDYLTWYCAGNEGRVSARVGEALAALGWKWATYLRA